MFSHRRDGGWRRAGAAALSLENNVSHKDTAPGSSDFHQFPRVITCFVGDRGQGPGARLGFAIDSRSSRDLFWIGFIPFG